MVKRTSPAFARMRHRLWSAVLLFMFAGVSGPVLANPTGLTSQTPGVTFSGVGTSAVTITSSARSSIVNAQGFNIAPTEVTNVIQSNNAAMFVRIGDLNPTSINGQLNAMGTLILLNPNGVFFGPQSQVNVGGLIASSLNITDTDFLNGRYAFQGTAANGAVRNEGQMTAGPFGIYLLAPNVTNNGVIKSPGGHVALAAGTTAYLSNRADGRGFLVEVTAPTGEALNLGSLMADGGQVSMIGRLVTQSGLVQANRVQKQNGIIKLVASDQATLGPAGRTIADGGEIAVSGRIIEQQGFVQSVGTSTQSGRVEYVATEQVNLRAGSHTNVNGGNTDVSDGGTIAAMATNPTSGTVTIESGAVLDVSGGAQGGHGGEIWLGGVAVPQTVSFLGNALAGYDSGILQMVPRTRTVTAADLTGGTSRSYLNFYALDDLTVNLPSANLTSRSIAPALDGTARDGTLRFFAGSNLRFNTSNILNGQQTTGAGALNRWDYVATAGNDILFNTTALRASKGGSIRLEAGRDVSLLPNFDATSGRWSGGHSVIQTQNGGDITIRAGRDLIAPSALQNTLYSGIRLDRIGSTTFDQGVGNLTIQVGRDFLGGLVAAAPAGPGFVLSNGTAQVTVERNVGTSDSYATFTLGSGTFQNLQIVPGSQTKAKANVSAGGSIYLSNVQDAGMAEGFTGSGARGGTLKAPTVHPESAASFTAQTGSVFLRPLDVDFSRPATHVLPPSFSVAAPGGNIFIQSDLEFWPSVPGSLSFSAGQTIQGSIGATGLATAVTFCRNVCPNISPGDVLQQGSISFTTATGDISTLKFDLFNSSGGKSTTIVSGNDIKDVLGPYIPAPDVGGATISAVRDIDLKTSDTNLFGVSGFTFVGTGTAKIVAGRNLDLANSQGLIHRTDFSPNTDANKGGLLDIAVGGYLNMDKSRIITENGASVWIHGIGSDSAVNAAGLPTLFNGQPIVLVADPQQGSNGKTTVTVEGKSVLLDGKPLVLSGSEPVITSGSLTIDGFPAQRLNGKSVVPVLHQAKPVLVNGKLIFLIDGQVTLVDARLVSVERPVGGLVNVGTNQNSFSDQTGIVTLRGGAIQIKAMDNVNVEQSRIASFGGGDITVTSTYGSINAGSGGKDQKVFVVIDQGVKVDAQGNPVIDPITGQPQRVTFSALVPGSGIFTFHPDDPRPLIFPVFNPISPFEAQVALHQFFGHDVSALLPKIPAAHDAWIAQYNRIFSQFITDKKLGNVTLNAAVDVIVPPAGIRGRDVTINAGRNLDLQGGTIEGRTSVTAGGTVVGSLSSFVGAFTVNLGGSTGTGSGGTLGLGSVSGSVGSVTTTSSVTASAATTSVTTQNAISEAATPQLVGQPKAAFGSPGKKGGEGTKAGSLRVKDKVRVKVETKPEVRDE